MDEHTDEHITLTKYKQTMMAKDETQAALKANSQDAIIQSLFQMADQIFI